MLVMRRPFLAEEIRNSVDLPYLFTIKTSRVLHAKNGLVELNCLFLSPSVQLGNTKKENKHVGEINSCK